MGFYSPRKIEIRLSSDGKHLKECSVLYLRNQAKNSELQLLTLILLSANWRNLGWEACELLHPLWDHPAFSCVPDSAETEVLLIHKCLIPDLATPPLFPRNAIHCFLFLTMKKTWNKNKQKEQAFVSLPSNAGNYICTSQFLWNIVIYQGISVKIAECFISIRKDLLINRHSLKHFGWGSTYMGTRAWVQMYKIVGDQRYCIQGRIKRCLIQLFPISLRDERTATRPCWRLRNCSVKSAAIGN